LCSSTFISIAQLFTPILHFAIHSIVLSVLPSLKTYHDSNILQSVLNTCFSYSPCQFPFLQIHLLHNFVYLLFFYKKYCGPYLLLFMLHLAPVSQYRT
jgi:hypothetical protein